MSEAGTPQSSAVTEFAEVMRRLRIECPWKREQNHRSLTRFLIEEAYETVDAIDHGEDTGDWAELREELGDLLLQVVFHALIAEERGDFDLDDVARDITEKMRRRNPHVFDQSDRAATPGSTVGSTVDPTAGATDLDADSVTDIWERAKAEEKQRASLTDGLPSTLPALLYADKLLDRSARAGRPVPTDPASDDLGERLLALVAQAREGGVDPEQALRDVVRRRCG